VLRVIDEERQRRDAADGNLSFLKQTLANIEWRVECLRSDIEQLDRLQNPAPIEGARRPEIVRRPQPGPEFVDPIVFPSGHTAAGEAA
jgi:hypothetical protein